ncbi:chemotaxis protein CheA [Spirochaeta isovalerica]|uniref:Chemotaxis protein CheA n=1 Tax=Spirochaeta isovalerica TaxID=150 RepID=A0A841R5B8_9SPIO|nr:chemotaxis protein CheA [Spirochaeta isovalerica]MBB6479013.1 two-component system chemotaxis sensor kinase CheA [Spirochaeta isovalerica]
MVDQFKEAFREEAFELLTELEDSLLRLEEEPDNPETISSVFRIMHTIKGSAAMFGFDDISLFTHEVENIMDLLRAGKLVVTKELIDMTLTSRDYIRIMLEDPSRKLDEEVQTLLGEFKAEVRNQNRDTFEEEPQSAPEVPLKPDEKESESPSYQSDELITYRIIFCPENNIFLSGTNPLLLLAELRELGEISILAVKEEIPPLSEINPEFNYTSWEIILSTTTPEEEVRDVFIFVESSAEVRINIISDSLDESGKKIGEILVDRGVVKSEDINEVLTGRKRVGEVLVENKLVTKPQLDSALEEQQQINRLMEKKKAITTSGSVRVDSGKLDELVDLVGEMVTVQAHLSELASHKQDASIISIAEQLERLTAELRDNSMSMRMLPIGTTFSKFKRLVRDLSADLGKGISLVTVGGETELDKTVIEKLNDPLIHLIRNSIDHGIESPEERIEAGKSAGGTITLSARHSGANVLITVADDGAGLDASKIRRKAIDKGLMLADEELPEGELFKMIFAPGFSTSSAITKVSGRGVGMDVVRKEIETLGGQVSISSEGGKGTAIELKLPLTLAIIEGLLVQIDEEFYVFPLSVVEECVEHIQDEQENGKQNIASVRGEILPFIRLREFFDIQGKPPEIEQLIVVNTHDHRIGFIVDEVIGDYQTVIKTLGSIYKDVEGLSGGTILGDGSIALILDVLKITQIVQKEEKLLT